MTSVTKTPPFSQTIELSPSYKIPIVLILLALPLTFWQPWVGIPLTLFGLFLLFQTVAIRLQFTNSSLDVYRSGQLIRTFPYGEWQDWQIFWDKMPILFYFKEVKSIHFLPIIFDPKNLKTCLEHYCPKS